MLFMPTTIFLVYFMLPKSIDSWTLRFVTWLAIVASDLYLIFFTRGKNPSVSALNGLTNAYCIMLATTHLITNNAKQDYRRISKEYLDKKITYQHPHEEYEPNYRYIWEPFPETAMLRLSWAVHLLTSLTGRGWSFMGSQDHLPVEVQMSLERGWDIPVIKQDKATSHDAGNTKPCPTGTSVLKDNLWRLLLNYLLLDVFKTIGALDPYFLGQTDFPAPRFLPAFIQSSSLLVRAFRLFIAQACMYLAIDSLLRALQNLHLGFHEISKRLGIPEPPPGALKYRGVTSEGWFWPEPFGPYSSVGKMGLSGFWASFWHQSFRLPFEGVWKLIKRFLQVDYASMGTSYLFIKSCVIFATSGVMHAALSFTSVGQSTPLRGSFMFFALQPVGLLLHDYLLKTLSRLGLFSEASGGRPWLRYSINLVVVNAWLILTAPLFVEDLSRGGLFLFEPLPISILRGLGFGNHDDGWICWSANWWA
jgi:Membrane bound O-acyl transferase family